MVKKLLFCVLFLIGSSVVAVQEKKLVIVVTSFNNAEWCVKNLETIFFQMNPENSGLYQNYRVIVIDDNSYDGNAEYIEKYIDDCNQRHRVILIKNKVRKRKMANLYYALQLCEPDEIVFDFDGDDFLADNQVFSLINSIYQNEKVWITYGSFINWPTNQMGYCKELDPDLVEKRLLRKKWWMPGQLRTFYAWLFHQILLQDLLFSGPYYRGQFFPANADLAIYYPMMEMAGLHYEFISKVIYIRNVATPLNDFKVNKEIQILGSKLIRDKELYPRLKNPLPDYFKQFSHQKLDIIFFSNNQSDAQKFVTSCNRLTRNGNAIYIMTNENITIDQSNNSCKVSVITTTPSSFKTELNSLLNKCAPYLIFAHDTIIFTEYIDFSESILALEKSFAYASFYALGCNKTISRTGMGEPVPALNQINETLFAWGFGYAEAHDWKKYNNRECTLYRTQTVKEQTKKLEFNNEKDFFEQWSKVPINLENIGLCYNNAKVGYSLY